MQIALPFDLGTTGRKDIEEPRLTLSVALVRRGAGGWS